MSTKEEMIKDLEENMGDGMFDLIANQGHDLTKDELKALAKELSYALYQMSKGVRLETVMKDVASELKEYEWA